jgi:hypothetical protein
MLDKTLDRTFSPVELIMLLETVRQADESSATYLAWLANPDVMPADERARETARVKARREVLARLLAKLGGIATV